MKDRTIKLEVSQNFYTWWSKQLCSNDQGLMFIAWSAWKACENKYKKEVEQDEHTNNSK